MFIGRLASLIGFAFFLFVGWWLFRSVTGNELAGPGEGIYMVQPSGVNPERDYAYSQTNKNNSEAQLNLANATAVIVDAQGNYIVDAARATQIVADSDWGPVNTYTAGQAQGSKFAFVFMAAVAVAVAMFFMMAIGKSK